MHMDFEDSITFPANLADAFNEYVAQRIRRKVALGNVLNYNKFSENFTKPFRLQFMKDNYLLGASAGTLNRMVMEEKQCAEAFAKLFGIIPNLKGAKHITNIGTGTTGAEAFEIKSFSPDSKLTAIDPQLLIVQKTVSGIMEVKHNKFNCDDSTIKGDDLGGTDVVLAARLFGSAEHLVHQCSKRRKPYLLLPCACVHKNLDGKSARDWKEQNEYLAGIDPDAKIVVANSEEIDCFLAITNMKLPENDFRLYDGSDVNKNRKLDGGVEIR